MDDETLVLVAQILSDEGDPDEAFKRLSEKVFLADRDQRRKAMLKESHEQILAKNRENDEEIWETQ